MNIGEGISGAVFSDFNRIFRYALWRIWDKSRSPLLFVGLNPSTATEYQDDPTIVRVARFARDNGYGGLFVGNLFSIVSADPSVLWVKPSFELPGGPNDTAIKRMRELSAATLAGWGNFGDKAGTRPDEVLAIVGKPVFCLGKTKTGQPKHPLYIRASTKFIKYERGTKIVY